MAGRWAMWALVVLDLMLCALFYGSTASDDWGPMATMVTVMLLHVLVLLMTSYEVHEDAIAASVGAAARLPPICQLDCRF